MSKLLASSPGTLVTLYFEPLEPRILLSADLLGGVFGDINHDNDLPGYQDIDISAASLDLQRTFQSAQPSSPSPLDLVALGLTLEPGDVEVSNLDEISGLLDSGDHQRRLEVVFVDASVSDQEQLLDGLTSNAQTDYLIYILDSNKDGVAQISAILSDLSGVDAIHILSHGEDGKVRLGNGDLSAESLEGYSSSILAWQQSLDAGADILFYGCNLASTDSGTLFLYELSRLTGADVAASDDLTGAAELGGDWELEVQTGVIETSNIISLDAQQDWQHLLVAPTTSGISDVNVLQGSSDTVIDLLSAFSDTEDPDNTLNYSIVSNTNASLFTAITIDNGANTLNLDYDSLVNGTTEITVRATDSELLTVDTVFTVTVSNEPIADAGTDQGINEGDVVMLDATGSTDIDGLALTNVQISGNEISVNTFTADDQKSGKIGIADDGSFVIVWEGVDTDQKGVFGQRYDSSGNAVGSEFQVNTTTLGDQKKSTVGMADDGSFVVTWEGVDANKKGVFAQRFDPSGNTIGSEFAVNTSTTGDQKEPDIAVGDDGSFVITWEGPDTDKKGVFGQRYDSSGNTVGSEFQVNTTTEGDQKKSAVGISDDGSFIVTWEGVDANLKGVFAQRFDASGSSVGSEFIVNTTTIGDQKEPDIAVADDGSFVVIWEGTDADLKGVFGQRFDPAGVAVGSEFQVNTVTTDNQFKPTVAMMDEGRFIVSWEGVDSDLGGIFVQRYEDDGTTIGGEIQINTVTLNKQGVPMVDINDSGDFVVAYEGVDVDGKGIFGQKYTSADDLTYSWTQISGDTVTLSDTSSPNPTFTAMPGMSDPVLIFELTVSDGINNSIDAVIVTVNRSPAATNLVSVSSYTEGDSSVPITDIVVSDPDTVPVQTITATLTLADPSAGLLTTSGSASYNIMSGVWTISSSLSEVNTALALVSFTPGVDQDQDTTINVHIEDQGGAGPSDGSITLDVTPVNDSPTTSNNTVLTSEDTNYTFNASDFNFADVDTGDVLASVKITSLESAGSLRLSGSDVILNQVIGKADIDAGNLVFVPVANANGPGYDSFEFSVNDGTVDSLVPATLTIDVTPVNDAPSGNIIITGTVTEDQVLLINTTSLTDSDGTGAFSYQWIRDGADIDGAITTVYTLDDIDVGASITVEVSYTDGDGNLELVSAPPVGPVSNVNDIPTGSVSVDGVAVEDEVLTANTSQIADKDGLGSLNYQWLRDGTPIPDENSAMYLITDADLGKRLSVVVTWTDAHDTGESTTSMETEVVMSSNEAPVALDQPTLEVFEDSAPTQLNLSNLFTDSDVDDELSFTVATISNNKLFSGVGIDGDLLTIEYSADQNGISEITIVATDKEGLTAESTVTINVASVNDAPGAVSDMKSIDEDSIITLPEADGVLANDSDIDTEDVISVTSVDNGIESAAPGELISGTNGGVFVIDNDGSYRFDPGLDFQDLAVGETRQTSVTYLIEDGSGETSHASLTITVHGNNDPVQANDDQKLTNKNNIISVDPANGVLANDIDPDESDSLNVRSVSNGSETVTAGESLRGTRGGTFIINDDGSFLFNPGTDFIELEAGEELTTQVSYVVTDSNGSSESKNLTVIVIGVSEPETVATIANEQAESLTPEDESPGLTGEVKEDVIEAPEADVAEAEVEEADEDPELTAETEADHDELLEPAIQEIEGQLFDQERQNIEAPYIGPGQSALQFLLNDSENETVRSTNPTETFKQLREIIESREEQLEIVSSTDFLNSINRLREDVISETQAAETVVGGSFVFSAGLSVGYVIWLVRSGILLSSVVSSLPAWRLVDPLPILSSFGDDFPEEEDDESLESIIAGDRESEQTRDWVEVEAEDSEVQEND